MKYAIKKTYGRKGEDIVNMNNMAIDRGGEVEEIAVPAEWANIEIKPEIDDPKRSGIYQTGFR